MKGGTLFSGIGAPEQAMPWVDWRWCAEIERFPAAVHQARFGTPNLGDVTKVDWNAVEPVDLLVFGSPCQSFSVAGKRLGLDDPRGNLALVALGVARRLRPEWLVFENVPGLLSSDGWRDFGAFLGLLGECGYGWAYRVLDAQHLGVPQRRRRIFVVGHLGDWRRAAAVLLEPESMRGDHPPRREAGQRVAPSLTVGAHGSGGHQYRQRGNEDALIAFGGNDTSGPIDVATACNAHGGPHGRLDFESETFIAHALRADGFDGSEDGTGRGTLNAENQHAIAFQASQSGMRLGAEHPTLDSNNGSRRHHGAVTAAGVRRLTPRECERLQGFPDDFTLIAYRGKPAADGPRYRALGNSMAVPVVAWIGDRLHIAALDATQLKDVGMA